MKFGFFTTFAPESTLSECAALAKELGYAGLQPRIAPGKPFDESKPANPWANNRNTIAEEDFFRQPKEVLKPITDAGLAVTSVAGYAGVGDAQRAQNLVKACAAAGIANLRVGPLPLPKGGLYDAAGLLADTIAAYKKLLEISRPAGVRLCVEIHMRTIAAGPDAVMRVVGEFNPKDVGVLYDPGNMVYEGHVPPRVALSVLGDYLAEVHVKNAKIERQPEPGPEGLVKWKAVPANLEEGVCDFAQVFEALVARGYEGWCIEEGHGGRRTTRERLAHSLDLMRRLEKHARDIFAAGK